MSIDSVGSIRIPVPEWLRAYQKEWLMLDIVAAPRPRQS